MNDYLASQFYDRYFAQSGKDDWRTSSKAWGAADFFSGMADSSKYLQNIPTVEGMLKQRLQGNNPLIAKARQLMTGNIRKSTDRAIESTDQNLASTGLRRAGIGTAARNKIFGGEASALAEGELGLAEREESSINQATAQLLGIDQMRLGAGQSDREYLMNVLGQNEQARQFNENLRLQQEGADFDWGGLLNSLIQAGATIIAASDKKVKKDIKYTGEKTKDGIPVATFKYKGDNKKYKGVIAQDVEKIKPEAVVNLLGIKGVNYGTI